MINALYFNLVYISRGGLLVLHYVLLPHNVRKVYPLCRNTYHIHHSTGCNHSHVKSVNTILSCMHEYTQCRNVYTFPNVLMVLHIKNHKQ